MSTAPIPAGNDVTTTPLYPDTPYNFCAASPKDKCLYTSERPGRDPPGKDATISIATVREWIAYMRAEPREISRVLVLIDDNELETYASPGLLALYEELLLAAIRPATASSNAAMNLVVDSLHFAVEKVES